MEARKASSYLPLLLVVMALMVIATGGYVRVSDTGESCPDWPTCFGTWGFDISEDEQEEWYEETGEYDSRGMNKRYTTFEIFTEWIHRLLATLSGMVVIGALIAAWRQGEALSKRTKKAGWIALALILSQGFLGMVTVVLDNDTWTVVLHLMFALGYTSWLLWWWLSWRADFGDLPDWAAAPIEGLPEKRKRVAIALGHVVPVLVLGVWVSTGEGGAYNQGCSVGFPRGYPLCQGELVPDIMASMAVMAAWVHRLAVGIVAVVLGFGLWKLHGAGDSDTIYQLYGLASLAYLVNMALGALYVILAAGEDGFPEHLSLMHLLCGASCVLFLALALVVSEVAGSPEDEEE